MEFLGNFPKRFYSGYKWHHVGLFVDFEHLLRVSKIKKQKERSVEFSCNIVVGVQPETILKENTAEFWSSDSNFDNEREFVYSGKTQTTFTCSKLAVETFWCFLLLSLKE